MICFQPVFVLALTFGLIQSKLNEFECDEFKSCSAYNSTNQFDYETSVYCNGASTCDSSVINSHNIWCYGDSSCQNTVLQSSNMSACIGYGSCINVTSSVRTLIPCRGYSSCLNSNISFDVSGFETYPIPVISCVATKSCVNMRLNSSSTYVPYYKSNYRTITGFAGGVFSTFNTTIYSNGNNIQLTMGGYYDGYGLNIHCTHSYDECIIGCYGNACVGITTDCCTQTCMDSSCDDYVLSNNNNNNNNTDRYNYDSMVGILDNEIRNIDNRFSLLPTSKDDYIDIVKSNTTCNNNQYVVVNSYNNYTTLSNKNITLTTANNTDICCLAVGMCWNTSITHTTNDNDNHLNVNYNYNVYCTASGSCLYSTITNVYSVYSFGDKSLWFATVRNFAGMVMCTGTDGCSHTILTNGPLVACMGYQACEFATIKNVNTVIGIGFQALVNATIINATTIYLLSYNSGYGLSILNSTENSVVYCQNNACKFKHSPTFNNSLFYCYNSKNITNLEICTITSHSPTIAPTQQPEESKSQKEFELFILFLNNITLTVAIFLLAIAFMLTMLSFAIRKKQHKHSMIYYTSLLTNDSDSFSVDDGISDDNDDNENDNDNESILNYVSGFGQNASHLVLLTAAIEIYDVFTDVSYLINLIINENYLLLFYIFLISMLLALILNSLFAIYFITFEFGRNNKFRIWFWKHSGIIIVIIVFCILTDGAMIVSFFTSQIFGNSIFYSPVSIDSIRAMNIVSIISIFVEHLPQLFVQAYVIFFKSETLIPIIVAPLVVSCIDILLVIVKLIIWFFVLKHTVKIQKKKTSNKIELN